MNEEPAKSKRGPFGLMIERLMPSGAKLSQLQRLVDVTGPHFYGLMSGERDGRPSRPSADLVQKFIDGLINLGADVSSAEAEDLMAFATTKLPEGWRAVKETQTDDMPPENYEDWPLELRQALAHTKTLTPEAQKLVYRLWKEQARAHADIEQRRQEAERQLMEREELLRQKSS